MCEVLRIAARHARRLADADAARAGRARLYPISDTRVQKPRPVPADLAQAWAKDADLAARMLWNDATVRWRSGVYVLFEGMDVVYVGQSEDIPLRLDQHLGKRASTRVATIRLGGADRLQAERNLLDLLVPVYNRDPRTRRLRAWRRLFEAEPA